MNRPYIFHIDFDSYFVSAIRSLKPHLKNKPVAIAKKSEHAIAVSVSYDLREKGFKAGCSVNEILKKVPNAYIEEPRFDLFIYKSNSIFKFLKKNYAKELEVGSIDECYLEINTFVKTDTQALNLAKEIQSVILNEFDIPITIGISKTKFYAKMTTNLYKPNGIGIANKENYKELFFDLDISKFHGIGKQLSKKFYEIGIQTIGQLYQLNKNDYKLRSIFKTSGYKYLDLLNYDLESKVISTPPEPKGVGHDITFGYNETEFDIYNHIKEQSIKISNKLNKIYKLGKLITFGIRNKEDNWIFKHKKLDKYTSSEDKIYNESIYLYKKYFINEKIIGISIRISELINIYENYENLSLFENKNRSNTNTKIQNIINNVNLKLKKKKLETLNEYNIKRIKKNRTQSSSIEIGVFKR
ncbi:DNA polymerase IV [Mycoplasmopsis felis]|uniref:Y-family DNA polymerase n=1 Tax=Mycoplasmopsis felis TaxID=33923 RepID=UPI0021DFD074|nr:DNA polymerase IV [Mycoplasmopsis felis]MCU9933780.1 DNA polymerase IV [Mycoplasmopsis felis]